MTLSAPFFALPGFIELLFSTTTMSRSSSEPFVPDVEEDRFERELLREMMFSNHGAINSDYDIAALMPLVSRQ